MIQSSDDDDDDNESFVDQLLQQKRQYTLRQLFTKDNKSIYKLMEINLQNELQSMLKEYTGWNNLVFMRLLVLIVLYYGNSTSKKKGYWILMTSSLIITQLSTKYKYLNSLSLLFTFILFLKRKSFASLEEFVTQTEYPSKKESLLVDLEYVERDLIQTETQWMYQPIVNCVSRLYDYCKKKVSVTRRSNTTPSSSSDVDVVVVDDTVCSVCLDYISFSQSTECYYCSSF